MYQIYLLAISSKSKFDMFIKNYFIFIERQNLACHLTQNYYTNTGDWLVFAT